MKKIHGILFLFLLFTSNLVFAQHSFSVINDIPHLALRDTATIKAPETGMLIYSSIDEKPLIYTGKAWESLCTTKIGNVTVEDFFTVKNGISYLPVLTSNPANNNKLGAIYYSSVNHSTMINNGTSWIKIRDIGSNSFTESKGFSAGVGVKTFKLPVLQSNPSTAGLTKGAFYINSLSRSIRYYDGLAWKDLKCIDLPTIITLPITDITSITALSGGDIIGDGGSPITARGIRWSVNGDPIDDPSAIMTNDGSGVGVFPSSLVGLLGNTTYYVRAYAVNSQGTVYGNLLQFTTPPSGPPVLSFATVNITDVTEKSAKGEVNILNNGGALVTDRGFVWSTDRINWVYGTSTTINKSDIGVFIGNLVALQPGTTYYAKGYATNSMGTTFTSETSFITNSAPLITTIKPTHITGTNAFSGGHISNNGGSTVTLRGICWSTEEFPTVDLVTKTEEPVGGDGIGNFNSILSGLSPGVKYYVRAYAVNVVGLTYGKQEIFSTPNYATVVTLSAASFFNNTATGGGQVLDDGGAPVTSRGVCWGTTENPTINGFYTSNGTGTGIFSSRLTGLLPNVTYHMRAYASNTVGTVYGADKMVVIIPEIPSVVTQAPIAITNISATAGGNVTDNGGASITSRGVRWSTTGDPIDDALAVVTTDGAADGTYESLLKSLMGNTTYYIRAYATNRYGTAYGELLEFKTLAPQAPVLNSPILTITNITETKASGNVTILNNGGAAVISRGIMYSTDRITYQVNESATQNLTDIGTFTSNLTGLLPGTLYYAKGYATNSAGTTYTKEMSFTTALNISLTTTPVSKITNTSAESGGHILSSGNSGVTYVGICWSTSPNPTLADDFISGAISETFVSKIGGLMGGTRYYVRAYAGNNSAVVYGNEETFVTAAPVLATVTTLEMVNISGTTALVKGRISDHGGSSLSGRGICWNTTGDSTVEDQYVESGNGLGDFFVGMNALTPLTKYYVRAYAVNSVGIAYGNELVFTTTTLPTIATLTTLPAYGITGFSANSGGEITSDGGSAVTVSGICWSTSGLPTTTDQHTSGGIGIGNFIHEITELKGNTTYYIRAYAINSVGTAYGDIQQLSTSDPVLATLMTKAGISGAQGITGNSGGTIANNGGASITARGLVWSTIAGFNPDTVSINRITALGGDSFNTTITGLKPGTAYYVRAFAINSVGIVYAANEERFSTFGLPLVTTSPIKTTSITSTGTLAGGNISNDGGAVVSASGVCWSTNRNPVLTDNHASNAAGMGSFTNKITELLGSTTYYVRAYASNSVGTAYGEEESFITLPPVLATITTEQAIATSATAASSGGHIETNGGAIVTTRGICWSTQPNFNPDTVSVNKTAETGYFTGSFTAKLTGLKQYTTYYVRAYVKNSVGTAYGNMVSFITPQLATLTTLYTTAIGSTSALSGGDIADEGGSAVYVRGVVWSNEPDFNPDTVTVNRTSNGRRDGVFTSNLKKLKANTTYFVRAYATNVAGTSYGNLLSFITNPPVLATLTTKDAIGITGSKAQSGGIITDNGGVEVTTRGLVWSIYSGFRPDTVIHNKTTHVGIGIGNFNSTITNLLPGTTYYIRAYTISNVGVAYGNELSFTTLTIPTLTTTAVSVSSLGTMATGGGTIISDGGAAVTNQGVVWSTMPNPSLGSPMQTVDDLITGNIFRSMLKGLEPITLYYVRAYATNNQGTAYGNEVTFTTPPVLPTLTTTYITAGSKSTATTGGTISKDGGAAITMRGVVWSKDRNFNPDTITVQKTQNGLGIGTFTSEVTNLVLSTAYYVRAYAVNSVGIAYGNQVTVTLFPTAPLINTTEITQLGGVSADAGGEITSDGGADITLKGLCWSTHSNPTINDSRSLNGSGMDVFSATMTNLTPNTLYYVRAYAVNKIGVAYGIERTFLTNAFPTLTVTTAVTYINATIATSGGEITNDGRTPILARGVTWNTTGNPTIGLGSKTVDNTTSGIGSFIAQLTGLSENTTYYVRAYATNAVGTTYGSQVSFTTLEVTLPMISTNSPSAISSSAATSGGDIVYDGGMPVTQRGICWSTSPNPTTALSTRINHASAGIGNFSIPFSGLVPGTKYYVRAYATNSKGTAYGAEENFVTPAVPPSVSLAVLSKPVMTGVDGTASVINNGGDVISDRGFYWSQVSKTPLVPLNLDSMIFVGTEAAFTGTIGGLTAGTKYYIWAYASNGVGVGLSSTPVIFTTPTLPMLTTNKPTTVLQNTATSGGLITSDGGMAVTARGVCWSLEINPTIDLPTKTVNGGGAGGFTSSITGLIKRTKYYIRAYATNSMGTSYGNLDSLTTIDMPTVTTTAATSILSTSVTSGGEVVSDGGMAVTARGVCWSTTANPTALLATKTINGTGTGVFIGNMTGLTYATKYYFRAYATNSVGTAYGVLDSVVTSAIAPSVTAVVVSKLAMFSVDGSATVTNNGGSVVSARGFYWNTTGKLPVLPLSPDSTLSLGAGGTTIVGTIAGLMQSTRYYVWAYASNDIGTGISPAYAIFTTPTLATLTTTKPTSITQNTANSGGNITSDGGMSVTVRGVCWSTKINPTVDLITKTTNGSGINSFVSNLTGLTKGTKYYIRAYATSSMGTSYGNLDSLTTLDAPSLITSPATAILSSSAVSGGEIIKDGGVTVTARGVCWSTSVNPTVLLTTKTVNGSGTGAFVSNMTGLSIATTYYFRAYATNSIGTAYGNLDSLTTPATLATVSDVKIINLIGAAADGSAQVTADGKASVTERGLVWSSTSAIPTLEDNKIMDAGTGLGSFIGAMTNLVEGPTYYIRAYAINSVGTAYSALVSSFKICYPITVIHKAGFNGAPVDKTVTYKTVNSTLSGAARCWITQNLGADRQASSVSDAAEAAAGWYWQFSRAQGYEYNIARIPASNAWTPWLTGIPDNTDWTSATDPCALLLGGGWRIPTNAEWTAVDAAPQNWGKDVDAYASELKLHNAGDLIFNSSGLLEKRGTEGHYWSSNQLSTFGYSLSISSTSSTILSNASNNYKAYGFSLRCLRDTVVLSKPLVSNVSLPTSEMTERSAQGSATVVSDGGLPITERGLVWSSTNITPTLSDNVLSNGLGLGDFKTTLNGLVEGPTYYVRAYATNINGTAYSPVVSSFKICNPFTAIHVEGLNGAPVSKTVTYGTISSNISGAARCWITQNLGSDRQASSANDNTEASSGWYWQFNRIQGYKQEGSVRTPSNAWTNWIDKINENSGWLSAQDPCALLLGSGWRLPTATEWIVADAGPQDWLTLSDHYNSVLKLHGAGLILATTGNFTGRGTQGYYWSSSNSTATAAKGYYNMAVGDLDKATAAAVRCLRDEIVMTLPLVSNVSVPVSGMTVVTASGLATVAIEGSAPVTERGLVWSSSNLMPTIADNKIVDSGTGAGDFTGVMKNLVEGPTYYVRAYAISSVGTVYSAIASSFKICNPFTVIHKAGFNGAPVDKTVTYKTVSSNLSGAARCWITQNLGAGQQATSVGDATETAAGWYWQFSRAQGYEYNTARAPLTAWLTGIPDNTDWTSATDPCTLLLGGGWRIPTNAEWTTVKSPPQNWLKDADAYASELKLHNAGDLIFNSSGLLEKRGTEGHYWSSTQISTFGYSLFISSTSSTILSNASNNYKAYGFSLRCLRD